MMRTPITKSKPTVRNANQIGSTPPPLRRPKKTNSVVLFSSEQMVATLYNTKFSPGDIYSDPDENKENVQSSNVKAATGKLDLIRSDVDRVESSIDKDFCEMFFGWLKKTENEVDADTFGKLRAELYTVVGKYTLANRTVSTK